MQRFESYGLVGTRQPAPAPVPDTLADPVLRRASEEVTLRQAAATAVTPARSAKPPPVVPVTARGFEARPGGAVALGAARGGDLAWAMHVIQNMDPAERRSFARTNRDLLARTVAHLDRLIDQLSGEQRANRRPSC